MSFFARLFGLNQEPRKFEHEPLYAQQSLYGQHATHYPQHTGDADAHAIERYRYMLRTAPPELIEQAHEEAFSKLTPEQRMQVLRELNAVVPAHERVPEAHGANDPHTLARMATRAELRQPGMIERTLGGMGGGMGGMGAGTMIAGTIFGALAAGFVGSMIAEQFMEGMTEDLAVDMVDDLAEDLAMEESLSSFEEF